MSHTSVSQQSAPFVTRSSFSFSRVVFSFLLFILALAAAPAAKAQMFSFSYGAGTGGKIQTEYPQGVYDGGTLMTFTAVANPGYTFVRWQITGSTLQGLATSAQTGFQITANTTLAAVFAPSTPPALSATHWKGQTNATWSGTNWASDAAGTATTAIPSSTSDITFSATGAQNLTTTLGQSFTIQSLRINSTAGIGGNSRMTINGGINVANGTLTLSNRVKVTSLSNNLVEAGGAALTVTGAATLWDSRAAVLTIGQAGPGALNVLDGGLVSGPVTLGQNVGGTGNMTVDGTGSGYESPQFKVGLAGTGTVTVSNNGFLNIGGPIELAVDSGSSGTFNIGSFGGNSTSGTIYASEVFGGNGTATVNFNQSENITPQPYRGENNSPLSFFRGSVKINQLGSGTTTLTGIGTYTGTTTVSAGALYINGDNTAATGNVTVSGGTLSGSGDIGGNVTVQSGGTITAGSDATSTGRLGTGNLSLASGSTALFQFAGTVADTFDVVRTTEFRATGTVSLNLQLTGSYTGAVGDTFKIFQADSYSLGTTTFNVTSNLGSQFRWDLSNLKTKGEVKIAIATPAPTVTGITPNTGGTLGGTAVTITGTDFTGATAVTIGGTAATGVNVVNATTITATTPAGVAGTASVVVTTASGSNAPNTLFTYEVLADLAVTLTSSPNSVPALGNLTFTLSLSNNGPSAAVNPTVSLPLPAPLTFVSANVPDGWQVSSPAVDAGGTVTFSRSSLANGGTASFTVTAKVKATTPNGTQWLATATCGSTSRDLASTNNSSSSPTSVGTVTPSSFQLTATSVLNRQNGLFDLTVNVTNTTPLPINGFRLHVNFAAYLAAYPSLRLYNSSSAPGSADVYVDFPYPVAVDVSIPVKLSFYTSTRTFPNPFAPVLAVETLATSAVPDSNGAGVEPRLVVLPDRNVMLEFDSIPGRWYRVRYSPNLTQWFDCPVPIQAANNRMQWIDSGAPFTSAPPPSVPSRYYRVNEINLSGN